jgi:hypothetical protein
VTKQRIGRLLLELGLVTQKQIDEALSAQQVYGGRLGTILVEHGIVHEDDLARVLSQQSGVPLVTREALLDIDPRVIALVPRSVAERFHVVPFRLELDPVRLVLATMDPANLRFSDELRFVLGKRVELRLCPEILLLHALEKHYGMTREKRFIRLERGESRAVRRLGVAPAAAAPAPATTGPEVLARLVAATEVEALLTIGLEALAAHGERVAFLALRADELTGWSGRGLTCSPEALSGVKLRLGDSDTARTVLAGHHHESLALDKVDARLRQVLERDLRLGPEDGEVLLIPLLVGEHVFGLFLVAGRPKDQGPDAAVLAELVRRVGMRAQAIHLTKAVGVPLPGL